MPLGNAIQRRFAAPSDHRGLLTSYGIKPGAGLCGFAGSKQPVRLSFAGAPGLPGAALVSLKT